MKNVKLTNEEIELVGEYLWENPCRSGCVYPEMQKSREGCSECKLTRIRDSILEKLDLG